MVQRRARGSAQSAEAAGRGVGVRDVASIRWSQWMVDGTAVLGRPEEMNCVRRGARRDE